MAKKYPYHDQASFAQMTDDDAQKIQLEMAELEFPRLYELALQFALFKTYGIPSISKLLVHTRQLSTRVNATKRYADTSVLITEFLSFPPSHPRTIAALARMNYLHSIWIKDGWISNDDLLYTLSLFALEPSRWIDRYEWRDMTTLELHACGTFWKSIGDGMGISYEPLMSYKQGWIDGLSWLREVEQWSDAYEEQQMVPHTANKTTADETTTLLLWYVPRPFKSAGRKAVTVLMSPRLASAMMYEPAPAFYAPLINGILHTRRLLLRYLSLPRPEFLRVRPVTETANATGRYHYNKYQAHPWYVEVNFCSRWGPGALLVRLLGGTVPGDEGSKYIPGGYITDEVGPAAHKNKGGAIMQKDVKKLERDRTGACPFASGKPSLL
ncbi:MAG: hypothetical protein M1814_004481 [Vezdaea aestivalis]|nr:MAG: hypothetical protein M1814_004481 [Vezdaea aestivalis]